MATNDKRTHLYNRKFTSINVLDTYFYDNLNTHIDNILSRIYPSGVLSGGTLSSTTNDTVTISDTEALSYNGKIIDISSQTIPFENNTGITYYIGIKYIEVEASNPTSSATETDAQTSTPDYAFWQEQIGEIDNPTSIFNDGDGTLTIVVDNVVGTDDISGRYIRIWLSTLLSTDSGWHEDLEITYGNTAYWVGNKNYVTTSGDFHQTSVKGTISTTPAAYRCWLGTEDITYGVIGGITITTTDISSNNDYIFLGTVTGNGPSAIPVVFDQSSMVSLVEYGDFNNYIVQLSKDIYGDKYVLNGLEEPSTRTFGTFTDGDVSPDISNYRTYYTGNTALTNINALDGGVKGDIRTIIANDSNTVLKSSVNLALANDSDLSMSMYDALTFKCMSTGTWYELYRSLN